LPADRALALLERLLAVPSARDPERLLEIILLDASGIGLAAGASAVPPPAKAIKASRPSPPGDPPRAANPSKAEPAAETPVEPAPVEESESTSSPQPTQPFDEGQWPAVLAALKQKHNTLYGVVRMAQPRFRDDGTVELAFAFAFHQKRLSEANNRRKLLETIQGVAGHEVTIECTLDASVASSPAIQADRPVANQPQQTAPQENSAELAAISNIFGGGELLES
jgi:hypothetical protein